MEEFFVKNENETRRMAKLLAQEVKKGAVIGLVGELGAGKTTFIQAFAKGLGIKNKITSPTFVLIKRYKIPNYGLRITDYLFHIDCYRIKNFKDILALDFQEIISNPQNIVIIEWAEKIKKILPKNKIWIKFKIVSPKERIIKFL